MIGHIKHMTGVLLLAGAVAGPSMIASHPAQADGIRIDLGFGGFRWGPSERPYYDRWARERGWEHRRWEELRDNERREYWQWRHSEHDRGRGHGHGHEKHKHHHRW